MVHSVVTIALTALLLAGLLVAQDLTSEQNAALDRTVREVMRCANIPSLSLAFVSFDPRVLHKKGYGTHDHGGQKHVDTRSVFCIGGATQAFTSVLLAKLLDHNPNVTWDTPIQNIIGHKIALPEQYLSRNLNLKDILAMRSGLSGMDIVPVAKPFSVEQLVSNLRYAPRVAGFRDKFIYNEVLFSVLEEVFKVLGGGTWRDLIRQHILKPLGMMSTTFAGPLSSNNEDLVKGAVLYSNRPSVLEEDTYSGLELVDSAASLCTTAEDMSKWLHFLLVGGQLGTDVIIRKEALEATYAAIQPRGTDEDPVIQGYRKPDIQESYSRDHNSLGWINGYYRGYSFISQDGSLPGYQALVTVIPSSKLAVYVAFNGDPDEKRYAAKVLLNILGIDLIIQGNSWLTANNVCSVMDNIYRASSKNRKDDRLTFGHRVPTSITRPLEDYANLFKNYAYGDVHVKFNASGNNILTLEYGMAVYKLEPTTKNSTFQLYVLEGSLWYSTSADWYKDNRRIFAEFASDSHDPDDRINTVSIHGFDRHHVPVFSTNAGPPHYDDSADNLECSASGLVAWQWPILLVITFVFFR